MKGREGRKLPWKGSGKRKRRDRKGKSRERMKEEKGEGVSRGREGDVSPHSSLYKLTVMPVSLTESKNT